MRGKERRSDIKVSNMMRLVLAGGVLSLAAACSEASQEQGRGEPTVRLEPTATRIIEPQPQDKPLIVTPRLIPTSTLASELTTVPSETSTVIATVEQIPTATSTGKVEAIERVNLDLLAEQAVEDYLKVGNIPFDEECDFARYGYCGSWVDTKGDLRLYEVGAPPDALVRVALAQSGDGWQVVGESFGGYPGSFEAPTAQYFMDVQSNVNGVVLGFNRVDVFGNGRVILRLYFENDSAGEVSWQSDIGASGIYIEDSAGNRYDSVDVGGRFAQNFSGGMPTGARWTGWHAYNIGNFNGSFSFNYPGGRQIDFSVSP